MIYPRARTRRVFIYIDIFGDGSPRFCLVLSPSLHGSITRSQVVAKLGAQALALLAASVLTQHYGSRLTPWIRRSSTILITTFAVVYGVYLLLAHTK